MSRYDPDVIARRIRSLRHDRGLRQPEVIAALGRRGTKRTVAWLSQIERAKQPPTTQQVVAFAELFDVTPNDILGFPSPPTPEEIKSIRDALEVLEFIRPEGRVIPAAIDTALNTARLTLAQWRFDT